MVESKSSIRSFGYIFGFLIITACILTHSKESLAFALNGLNLWFGSMIPALLPFMILSGTMVRMGMTEGFTALVYPVLNPLFRISRNACYVIVMGFMCGFPMGAKCIDDLYSRNMLTLSEAKWLLAFCNNIGPVYFTSFALPLIGCKNLWPCVIDMYGLPFLYGFILRYTIYRFPQKEINNSLNKPNHGVGPLEALNESVAASLQSILSLGGYMVLFNLLMLLPKLFVENYAIYLAPILEITGGLKLLDNRMPLYSLIVLPFGGVSCIAQTYSCIAKTDLTIGPYIIHKLILTAISVLYYFCCLRFWRLW